MFEAPLQLTVTGGSAPISGLVDVTRSEAELLELSKSDFTLELRFPPTDGASLLPPGSQVELITHVEDTFFFSLSDPESGELMFEVGDAALARAYSAGHIGVTDRAEEPTCHLAGGDPPETVSVESIAFDTDDGSVFLRAGEQAIASIAGNPVSLQAFGAFRFDNVPNDGLLAEGPAMIVRLVP